MCVYVYECVCEREYVSVCFFRSLLSSLCLLLSLARSLACSLAIDLLEFVSRFKHAYVDFPLCGRESVCVCRIMDINGERDSREFFL